MFALTASVSGSGSRPSGPTFGPVCGQVPRGRLSVVGTLES
jgi:hypothetical protein